MKIELTSQEICLADSRPLRIEQARGQRITCTAGTLWITETGIACDIFLAAGETHEVQTNGLLLVESVGNGRMLL